MYKQISSISFIADSLKDLKDIPKDRSVLGAECFVIETGQEYKCNSKGEWKAPFEKDIIVENNITVQGGGSSEGEGGTQPDWKQWDETASNYIKNRPVYVDKKIKSEFTMNINSENGILQTFSRDNEEIQFGSFLLEYCSCDITIISDQGIVVEKNNNLWIEQTMDSDDREKYYVQGNGFELYCYSDEPNIIYYKGCRFGDLRISTYEKTLNVFNDEDCVQLRNSLQSDWVTDDITDVSYIKNRPFYYQHGYEYYLDLIDASLNTQFSKYEYNLQQFLNPEFPQEQFKIITNSGNEYTLNIQHSYDYISWNDTIKNYNKYVCWYGDMPSFLGDISICGFSFARAITSLSSPSESVIFCFCATCFTLFIKSR